jgi:hypothetical protein
MRRRWILEVDGRRCRLDVEWDMIMTSRGEAWVDGERVAEWWPGVKVPGVQTMVPVYGRTACMVGFTGDFDIDLSRSPGVRSIDPPLPPDYSPAERVRASWTIMWGVIGVAVVIPVILTAIAVLLRAN